MREERFNLKKIVPILAVVTLLLQTLVGPVVAVADTLGATDNLPKINLTSINAELREGDQEVTSIEKDKAYQLHVTGDFTKNETELAELLITISNNFKLVNQQVALTNLNGKGLGQASTADQEINLAINEEIIAEEKFSLDLAVTYQGQEAVTNDSLALNSSLGTTEIPVAVTGTETSSSELATSETEEAEETKETEASTEEVTEESSEATTSTESKEPAKKLSLRNSDLFDGKEIKENIIKDLTYTVEPAGDVTIDSTISLKVDWSLPEKLRKSMVGGETFSFDLAPEFKIGSGFSGDFKNDDGKPYASYTVSEAGKVVITFNPNVAEMEDIQGSFNIKTTLNEKLITKEETYTIKNPIKDKDFTIEIPVTSKIEEEIGKTGQANKDKNATAIDWTLMVNTAQKNLTNLTITDTLPTGLVIAKAEDVKIYAVSVDINGKLTGGKELVSPNEYDLDIKTGQIKFKGTTNKAYQIEYQTQIEESAKLAEGGDLDFKNNVKQTSDNGKDLSTSATVGVNYGVLLNKSNGVYDPATETASWSVEYNYGEKKLNEKDSYLEDTFDESMVLVKESVKLYEQVADEKGNFSNGRELVLGTDYELVEKGSSFKVTFTKGLAHAVKMTYDTKFKDNYFVDSDTKNVKNKVTTEGGTDEGTTEGVYQNGLVKSVKDYDYTNETIDWQLTVNQSKYTMKNWKLEDIFANKGLTFLAETLEVRLNDADGEVLKAGTDYDVSPKPDKAGFDLALIGKYATTNETLYISYRTSYDKNELADKSRGFYNRAIATWTDTNDGTHKNDVGAEHKPNAETFNNGSKSGVYDAETKLITWTINVNYNRKEIIDGSISDKINGNQKYVAKSAVLKEFTVDKKGNIETGKVLTDAGVIEPTVENKATLKVSLPSPSEKMGYQLTFQTSLAGEIIEKQDSYKNTAEFYTEKGLQDTLTADVTIKNGGTFATKRGNQNQENEKQADWEIRANESQSTVSGFTVIDEPSLNQVIKEETVKITEMKTDKNGDQSYTDKVLTRDEDYSLVITQDLATGQETMTISFLKEITKTYGISYSTDLLLTDGDNTLTNKVSAYGDNEKVTVENVSEKINVYYTDHDGTSSGKISEVFIRKEDDHKRKLAGVKFQLFNKAGKMVRENTTDENGLIHFANILSGTYTLKEVTRNSGYMLDKSLTEGTKEIKVVRGETNEANPLIVVNTLNEVRMQKVKEDGTPLAGAIFSLAKENTQGQFEVLPAFQKIATNEKGELLIEGLAIGNYQLTEVEAAPGFIKNTEVKTFKITGNEIAAVNLGEFINYQGQASLIKKDSQETPISGAVFSLFNNKMQPLNISATASQSGLVEFKNLAPGSYIVLETAAAPGYMLNKTSQKFTIVNEAKGEVANVTLNDVVNYQGSAQLTKVNEAGKGLPGAVFEVLNENQEVVKDKLVSDEAGLVEVTNLAPGTYFFKEVQAPKGYVLNTETYEFTIAAEAITAPAVIKVGQAVNYQGSAELVKQNQAGNPLKDAQFKVTDAKGKQVGEMLTTNREGKIFMDHLAPGTYYFEEIKAPTGYILNTEKIEFTISPEAAGEPAAVTGLELINYLGSAQLVKTNEDNLALAGATFKVETEQGQVIETDLISDENGLVTVQDLAPGKYAFIETKAAPGHMLNKTPITFEIVAEAAGQPVLVNAGSLINYQGGAQLTKVSEAGETLSEAVFSLFNEAKEPIASGLTSNDKGLIEVKNLAPGNYYFEETQAPTGYILNEEPVSFTISHEATATPTTVEVDFINYQGEIVFRKVSGDVRPRATFVDNGLAGAEFKLEKLVARSTLEAETDEEVEDVAIIKADKTGLVKVTGLAPGDYKMTEIKAPTGYITRTKVFEFTIEGSAKGRPEHAYGTEQGAVFENYQGTAELIKTNKEGQGLVGAEFKVTDEAGEAVLEGLTSDDTGKVLAENLAPGKYFFVETQAPTGYVINSSPVAFTIDEESESGRSDVKGLELINYQGSVELSKRDQEGNPLAGAVFSIIDEQDKVVFENLVSNETGLVSQSDIKPGTYRLIETQAPTGYIINSEPVEFTIAATSETGHADINKLELINYQGSAQLVKKDSQGNALAGAKFKVFDANDKPVGDVLTSDEEGNITVKGLAPGTYYFEEIKAPTGYILNSEPVEFIIEKTTNGQPKVVKDLELINYQGAAELTKKDSQGNGLAGAKFEVVDANNKPVGDVLTSDDEGKISIAGLIPGVYTIKEIQAPTGYILNETTVEFEIKDALKGQPKTMSGLELINYQGTVELSKKDNQGKGLAGAEFSLFKESEDHEDVLIAEKLVSDDKGILSEKNLAPGTYYFVETKAPSGFIINSEQQAFTIAEQSESGRSDITGLELVNYQGSAQLLKTNEASLPLAGATFKVETATGELVAENLLSDETGLVTVDNLAPGKYVFIETKAAPEHMLNQTPKAFEILASAEAQPEIAEAGSLINYQGSVSLEKVNEAGNALTGVEFSLFLKASVKGEKDQVIAEELVSDEKGLISVSDLAPGTYYFVETKALTNYILNTERQEFSIKNTANEKPVPEYVEVINYQGAVQLTKLSADAEQKTLAGAEFKLVDETGKVLKEKLTTDKAGKIKFTDLAPGKYHFIETKAPNGYQLDETPVPFKIETVLAGQPNVIEVTAWNTAIDPVEPLKPGKTDQSKPNNKPTNKLPQTNEASSLLLTLVGMTLISVAFVATKRKKL